MRRANESIRIGEKVDFRKGDRMNIASEEEKRIYDSGYEDGFKEGQEQLLREMGLIFD